MPTSACTPTTLPWPAPPIDFTAASSASRPRAMIATSAPDCAKRVATPSPMPLLPPVTMAERPDKLTSIDLSALSGYLHHRTVCEPRHIAVADLPLDCISASGNHRQHCA